MTKVIMTNSFRGGTGKSTIICNLASYLASFGYKVVLIDNDVISPGVHTFFGLNAKDFDKTLTDFLISDTDVTEIIYDISENLGLADETLFLIPSTVSEVNIVELLHQEENYEKIGLSLEKIKKMFKPDFIMVDTHPGVNQAFLVATNFTDILLNIIRPDNQDYQGAEVAAKISKKINLKTFFVLNKVHEKLRSPKLVKKIEKSFGLPVAGMVPLTEEIILAQSQYVFSDKYPNHPFSKEIQAIGSKVFGVKPKVHLELMHYLLTEINKKITIDMSELLNLKKVRFQRCKIYISNLIDSGFIVKKKSTVKITKKGQNFLDKYKTIRKFVDDFRI
jgi:MinD-like ATPase involved in chromosome partitioning or flagellar assembly